MDQVKRFLGMVKKVPVSDLCEEFGVQYSTAQHKPSHTAFP